MTKVLTTKLLRRAAAHSAKGMQIQLELTEAFTARYGITYSDAECEGLIDVLDFGGGTVDLATADAMMLQSGYPTLTSTGGVMAERPILFSGPMVQAILAGRKTQTRRVSRYQPGPELLRLDPPQLPHEPLWCAQYEFGGTCFPLPYSVGDLLWVREAWRTWRDFDHLPPSRLPTWPMAVPIFFEVDRDNCDRHGRYRHARFMPRWASRITLRVTAVKVERLQDISEADARAEGVRIAAEFPAATDNADTYREGFRSLWSSINGPDSWEANPWVAAYTFERVKP